jgi:hypothetical protein
VPGLQGARRRFRRARWTVRVRESRANPQVSLGIVVVAALAVLGSAAMGQAIIGSAVAAGGVLLWLLAVRLSQPASVGAGGSEGTAGGGSAGVREPRRPKPNPPAGALALPLPVSHEPDVPSATS